MGVGLSAPTPVSAVSQLPSAQSCPRTEVAGFGGGAFRPRHMHGFRRRKGPLLLSCVPRGVWLMVDAQENITMENRAGHP